MRNVTVSYSGPSRIRVGWSDEEADYHFIAAVVGIGETFEVLPSSYHPYPTIFRKARKSSGRGPASGLSYHNANDPKWAAFLAEVREWIADECMITRASAAHAAEERERQANAVKSKAEIMRRHLRYILPAISSAPDGELARAYDSIQNSVW